MKKLLKLMLQNYPLRDKDGAAGADGGGADKNADLAAQLAELKAQLDELKAGKGAQPEPEPKDPSVIEKAQQEALLRAQQEQARARMQNAIKFNFGIAKYVEENKDYLTKLSGEIVKTVQAKQFSDEEVLARTMQASLLEDFFSQQENMDAAPAELKPRIMAFKALTQDEKEKQASHYWDVLTLTLGQKKMAAQVAAAKRANSGIYDEPNDVIKQYNDRVFAMKSHYLGEKEQAK